MIDTAYQDPAAPPPHSRAETLLGCLREIEKVGQKLQSALTTRKTEAIWQIVEMQEYSMRKFAACYEAYRAEREEKLAQDSAAGQADAADQGESLIHELARRIKNVYRVNRALAHSFLDVIDRTLAGFSASRGGNPFVYNATGRLGQFSTPLLVQQQG